MPPEEGQFPMLDILHCRKQKMKCRTLIHIIPVPQVGRIYEQMEQSIKRKQKLKNSLRQTLPHHVPSISEKELEHA